MTKSVKLEDLVDLELQLQRDDQEEQQRLRQRDAAIGKAIGADQLDEQQLPLAWLAEIRRSTGQNESISPGRQFKQYLSLTAWLLAVLGFLLGTSTVAGWLRIDPSRPVNTISFWGVVVGLQVLLVCGWVVTVIPSHWMSQLPGAAGLQLLLRSFGQLLPWLTGWIAGRTSEKHRQTMIELRATVTRFDWLYGKIRFWLLIALTQAFALSYNLGAVGAFVALTHANDPAFCWRSTNWEANDIHAQSKWISWPWSEFAPQATLTLEEVESTRFSSSDQGYMKDATEIRRRAWKRWSLFLLASLISYGLLPRFLTATVALWNVRQAIANVKLDHAGYQKLRDRLNRHFVETRAVQPDDDLSEGEPSAATTLPPQIPDADTNGAGPFPAIKCDGVTLADDEIMRIIANRFGKSVSTIHRVLGADVQADQQVLKDVSHPSAPGEIFVLVEAWRPPVGEYLDLLETLRSELGDGQMIDVLLYDQDSGGKSVQPKPRHAEMWQRKLATIGDPWLRVDSLVEEPAA